MPDSSYDNQLHFCHQCWNTDLRGCFSLTQLTTWQQCSLLIVARQDRNSTWLTPPMSQITFAMALSTDAIAWNFCGGGGGGGESASFRCFYACFDCGVKWYTQVVSSHVMMQYRKSWPFLSKLFNSFKTKKVSLWFERPYFKFGCRLNFVWLSHIS